MTEAVKITRTKDDLMRELLDTKRELAQVKRELENVSADRAKLNTQVRSLTAEQNLWQSRNTGAGRIIGELRHQRAEVLQSLARVLADLAAAPETSSYIRRPNPAPEKDEAPF
jgi:chromosome segregation ATPase